MRTTRAIVLTLGIVAAGGSTARAYDFTFDLRTVGQGYQVRRLAPTGARAMLNRRRLTQYLDLRIWDLEPASWRAGRAGRDADHGRNGLYMDLSMRFDSDFGGFLLDRPRGDDEIRELEQNQVDLLWAVVGAQGLGGVVDARVGRQIRLEVVDFVAWDGGDIAVRLPGGISAGAFAGTEVRAERPLGSPIFDEDGTSPGARDPRTHPAQWDMLRPLWGATLALVQPHVDARAGYRRSWSATADDTALASAGAPESGIGAEKAWGSLFLHGGPFWMTGAARWDRLVSAVDDGLVEAGVRAGPVRLTLGATHALPTFDGDSIWNVFARGPTDDLRLGLGVQVGASVDVQAAGFVRRMLDDQGPGATREITGGGNLGARWWRQRWHLRADAFGEGGFGGRRVGGDLAGRYAVVGDDMEIEGRATGYGFRPDVRPDNDAGAGVSFGVAAGTRHRLARDMNLHLVLEDNFGTFYRWALRGLVVLDVEVGL